MDYSIIKYPRTQHLQGSRIQPGDEDLSQIPFASILGRAIVVEEKFDGANTAVSFDDAGTLLLQSRGHYLRGGGRERHYELFKRWGAAQQAILHDVLGDRYVMYGEWLYAKHAVFYDALPHYFLEFDVYDREKNVFLDTDRRRALLDGAPIVPARILAQGRVFKSADEIIELLADSTSISSNNRVNLQIACERADVEPEPVLEETDPSRQMEGLYIKVEENGEVVERMKFVRSSFYQAAASSSADSTAQWLAKPIVANQLRIPFDAIFDSTLPSNANFD